ncbi:MAG: helix-turn-helix transcriptional regulator [Gelidibacter sp.]
MNRLNKENLVSSRWVEQESGIPRKYYVLTETGKETLSQMQSYWEDLSTSIKKISK